MGTLQYRNGCRNGQKENAQNFSGVVGSLAEVVEPPGYHLTSSMSGVVGRIIGLLCCWLVRDCWGVVPLILRFIISLC